MQQTRSVESFQKKKKKRSEAQTHNRASDRENEKDTLKTLVLSGMELLFKILMYALFSKRRAPDNNLEVEDER